MSGENVSREKVFLAPAEYDDEMQERMDADPSFRALIEATNERSMTYSQIVASIKETE